MSFTMPDIAETRRVMLEAYRDGLRDMIEEVTQRIPDPADEDDDAQAIAEWANVPVVTRRDVDEALNAIFGQPVPMPSETWAEVHTPATIVVSTICPKCGLAQPISMTVKPELLVSEDGSELRLKAKAKGRTHICGQLPLPVTEDVAGQQELPLDDEADEDLAEPEPLRLLAGDELDANDDREQYPVAEPCPAPLCMLEADHSGPHARDAERADDDLLPV